MEILRMPEPDVELYQLVDLRTMVAKPNTDKGRDCVDAYTRESYRAYQTVGRKKIDFAAYPLTDGTPGKMLFDRISEGLLIVKMPVLAKEVTGQ